MQTRLRSGKKFKYDRYPLLNGVQAGCIFYLRTKASFLGLNNPISGFVRYFKDVLLITHSKCCGSACVRTKR
jgi:hypothetical protein